ncbi:hypothetical protein LUZ60_009728 [Juncus effusus]|nr:hypothetical protein LUZ60_009728 [Juncus effusus]
MAFSSLSTLISLIILADHFKHCYPIHQNYTAIFSFGDSLTDTGNLLASDALSFSYIGRYPYGMTYFKQPTGRSSDGRLIIDFIAEEFGLPMLPPYLAHDGNFSQGANFAVGGATALDSSFFHKIGAKHIHWTNHSLSAQLAWFDQLKPSLCNFIKECDDYFNKALFLVGEIGGNDYNYAFFMGKPLDEVQSFVPKVVGAIVGATEKLINNGAMHLVVPGNLPVGCSPAYLTLFASLNKTEYDSETRCLKKLNAFAMYHNSLLQNELVRLQKKYPQTRIIYADYYGAVIPFVHSPKHFGFTHGALTTCCGGDGPYNFNPSVWCGHQGTTVCGNPSSYANWDGIHLTEAAYHAMAVSLLHGPSTTPPLLRN